MNRIIEKYNDGILKAFGGIRQAKSKIHVALAANKIFSSVVEKVEGSWKETLWETIKSESANLWVSSSLSKSVGGGAVHDGEELAEADETLTSTSPSSSSSSSSSSNNIGGGASFETGVVGALDGFTYGKPVMDAELDLLLNQVCNSRVFASSLPLSSSSSSFSSSGRRMTERATCCVDYPKPKWKSVLTLLLLAFIGPFAFIVRRLFMGKNLSKKIESRQTLNPPPPFFFFNLLLS